MDEENRCNDTVSQRPCQQAKLMEDPLEANQPAGKFLVKDGYPSNDKE